MSTLVTEHDGTERRPANLRWWLLAILFPGVTAWTWYYFGEPAAFVVGISATALVVRQFQAERDRRFYPRGLIATSVLVAVLAIPLASWRVWTSIQHQQLVAKISLIEKAGGTCGWDASRIQFESDSITNANLASVSELTDTRQLSLHRTHIDDDGLAAIRNWDGLEYLWITYCPISDRGLVHVTGLRNLVLLDLFSNGITDAGLSQLGDLKKLETLRIQSNAVTPAGIQKLQQALPNCKIEVQAMPDDAPNADWPPK